MFNCINVRYLARKEESMDLTIVELVKFFKIRILMSCLKFSQIKMFWAKNNKVNFGAYF